MKFGVKKSGENISKKMETFHKPVLLKETIELLDIKKNEIYIDATIGGGGHSIEILRAGGILIGIDCDPEAIEFTRKRLNQACPLGAFRWTLINDNFVNLEKIVKSLNIEKVGGILFDLGVSSYQLETPKRGFSFNADAKLDMRMDPRLSVTAADLVNALNEGELYELFTKYGEEFHSRAIARAICRARRAKPILTCNQLAQIIVRSVPKRGRYDRTHPATRVFQALRIAVNDEINNLKEALPQTEKILKSGGRLVVLSFHSLEDRIVKNFMKEKERLGSFKVLFKKPLIPSKEEILENPRSRSAKLRAGEKL